MSDLTELMKQTSLFAQETIENLKREQPQNAEGIAQLVQRGKSWFDVRVRNVHGTDPMIDLLLVDAEGEHVLGTQAMKRVTAQ